MSLNFSVQHSHFLCGLSFSWFFFCGHHGLCWVPERSAYRIIWGLLEQDCFTASFRCCCLECQRKELHLSSTCEWQTGFYLTLWCWLLTVYYEASRWCMLSCCKELINCCKTHCHRNFILVFFYFHPVAQWVKKVLWCSASVFLCVRVSVR